MAKLANTSVETAGQESNESQIPERKAAMTLENLVEEKHAKWEEGGRDKGAILPGLRALGPPKDPLNFGSHVSPFTPTPIRNRDAGTAGQTTKAEGEGIKGRFPSPYLGDPFSSPLYGDESEATPTVGQKGRENINDGVVGSVPIAFLSPENLANANLLPAILAGNTSDGKDMSNAALLQAMPHTTVGDLVKLVAIKLRGEASLDQAQYAEAFRRLEQRAVHFMQSLRDESSPIVLQYVHFSLDTDIKLLNETQAGLLNRILRAVGRTAVADFKKSVSLPSGPVADLPDASRRLPTPAAAPPTALPRSRTGVEELAHAGRRLGYSPAYLGGQRGVAMSNTLECPSIVEVVAWSTCVDLAVLDNHQLFGTAAACHCESMGYPALLVLVSVMAHHWNQGEAVRSLVEASQRGRLGTRMEAKTELRRTGGMLSAVTGTRTAAVQRFVCRTPKTAHKAHFKKK